MPDPATEVRIVLANLPDAPERLVQRAVAAVQKVRQMEVEHKPVPSETVQWVMDIMGMFGPDAEGTPDQLAAALPAICKNAEDETVFNSALPTGSTSLFTGGNDRDSGSRLPRGETWNVRR